MNKKIGFLVLFFVLVLNSGCGAWMNLSRTLFTNAKIEDLELEGVARGCAPITGSILSAIGNSNETILAIARISELLNTSDPLGCVLQIERVGETEPFFVFCGEANGMYKKCSSIKVNSSVHVSGSPVGPGGLLVPSRITWDE